MIDFGRVAFHEQVTRRGRNLPGSCLFRLGRGSRLVKAEAAEVRLQLRLGSRKLRLHVSALRTLALAAAGS
jgi:hypothetical protein